MKYVVVTRYDTSWITEAETIAEACEQFDWKYPGTVVSVTELPSITDDMRGKEE